MARRRRSDRFPPAQIAAHGRLVVAYLAIHAESLDLGLMWRAFAAFIRRGPGEIPSGE